MAEYELGADFVEFEQIADKGTVAINPKLVSSVELSEAANTMVHTATHTYYLETDMDEVVFLLRGGEARHHDL